jgi:hypothetical protein
VLNAIQTSGRKVYLVVVGVALAVLATTNGLWAGELTYWGSLQASRGTYIYSENTTNISLFSGLSIYDEPLRVSVNLPVVFQSHPWVTNTGVGVLPGRPQRQPLGAAAALATAVQDTLDVSEIGIGDLVVRAEFDVLKIQDTPQTVLLFVETKVPVASVEDGFGTGEWDYGTGLSLSRVFGGTFVSADVGYWILGDMPQLEFKDPVSYGAAVGFYFAAGSGGVMLSYSGSTEVIEEAGAPSQIGLGANYRLEEDIGINGMLSVGLSDSSPAFSLSFGWQVPFK